MWKVLGLASGLTLAMYLAFLFTLLLLGRRTDARAWAGFVPDCVILFTRLARNRRVPRRHKWLLVALIAYLSLPFDLVPDFIPVAGALDDAILVAIVLRTVLRKAGRELVHEHWPGPQRSLDLMLRLAGRPPGSVSEI
ncbi:MAG: DUF1232 domain-containing protein [Actinomycetota bacterium]|nr:DUF1232 domain-containing protein [Actinomycetota bacterium]